MGLKRRSTKRISKKINIKVDEPLCSLCDLKTSEPYLGQLLCQSNFYVHENCLFFSPVLNQELDPSITREGYILGFKILDIEKEIRRIKRLKCSICKEKKAGIGCCSNACRKSFHLVCGLQHGAMGTFVDTFQFYCKEHAEHQDLKSQMMLCKQVVPECTICLELALADEYEASGEDWTHFVEIVHRREIIHGMCCNRSWMHRTCMSRYGLSAGLHHVKCPNCGNTASFVNTVQKCGIWLPDRDASWELEPGAFQDMYEFESSPANVCDSLEINDFANHISDSNNSGQPSLVLSDTNNENINLDKPVNESSSYSNEIIQTDIRKYLTPPSSNIPDKPQKVGNRKRMRQNDLPIVPVKRRRKSQDKILQTANLIHRQCSRCSRSLVCFSYQTKCTDANEDGLVDDDSYICVSCF